MKARHTLSVVLLLFACGWLYAKAGMGTAPVMVSVNDSRRIELEINSPEPEFESQSINGESYYRIRMAETETSGRVGQPDLPLFSSMVAIPINAYYSVSYETSQARNIYDIKPYPVTNGSQVGILDDVYRGSTKYPTEQVNYTGDAWVRDF